MKPLKQKSIVNYIALICIAISLITVSIVSCVSEETQSSQKSQVEQEEAAQQSSQASASPNYTGDGGKDMSIAILAPKATGLADNQSYLPALVQGEFVSNFSGFSAISVLDRQRLDEQYAELLSGYYDDNAQAGSDLGHLTPTTHIMGGSITRTATGYALQIQITKSADKMTTASYSGTCTFEELDNLTGIRRVSLDLLKKLGVTLTAQGQGELAGAATENQINGQTALARGIAAQRQGTEVAALSYYSQAAMFDPSLHEAANRSSILNANITSGNIGDNVRNDIAWRRDWVARLTETEQYFDSFNKMDSMPYTLFYTNEIKQGAVNYQNETVTLSIETHLHGSGVWTLSIERALQAVYDGLIATQRARTWELASWPWQGVTKLNAFARRNGNFSVVFELLNDQDKVIGKQTLQTGGRWELSGGSRPVISVNADNRQTLNFQNVNANDISDRMTIRVTAVNGMDPVTAARNGVLQIRASNNKEFDLNDLFMFAKGEIQGFSNEGHKKVNQLQHPLVNIPGAIWGDPVIYIGEGAFKNTRLYRISVPDSVISIGKEAFAYNELNTIAIGNNVASIEDRAFYNNQMSDVTIPSSVKFIGKEAFYLGYSLSFGFGVKFPVTIGENVDMMGDPFPITVMDTIKHQKMTYETFQNSYNKNSRKAGTYTLEMIFGGPRWKYSPQ